MRFNFSGARTSILSSAFGRVMRIVASFAGPILPSPEGPSPLAAGLPVFVRRSDAGPLDERNGSDVLVEEDRTVALGAGEAGVGAEIEAGPLERLRPLGIERPGEAFRFDGRNIIAKHQVVGLHVDERSGKAGKPALVDRRELALHRIEVPPREAGGDAGKLVAARTSS